jgi:hypothetical protein
LGDDDAGSGDDDLDGLYPTGWRDRSAAVGVVLVGGGRWDERKSNLIQLVGFTISNVFTDDHRRESRILYTDNEIIYKMFQPVRSGYSRVQPRFWIL